MREHDIAPFDSSMDARFAQVGRDVGSQSGSVPLVRTTECPPPSSRTSVADSQPLDRLAGHLPDQVEVLVEMQDNQAGELSGSGDHEVRNTWRPVLAAVGEKKLDLDGAVLDGRREVLNRHGGKRGDIQLSPPGGGCAGRVAQLEAGQRDDADQPPVDAVGPGLVVGAAPEAGIGRLVDQPVWRRPRHGWLGLSAPCAGHDVGIVEVGEDAGRPLEIGNCDCGARTGLGGERSSEVLVAGEAEAPGIGVDGDDHVLGQVADEDVWQRTTSWEEDITDISRVKIGGDNGSCITRDTIVHG